MISESSDVAVMNYPDLNNVLKLKKLEFGIELPAEIKDRIMKFVHSKGIYPDELNPFVDWDIDVQARFNQIGWQEFIPGFYTREYEQNPITHDWDDIGTNYPFRIRFAPPNIGAWTAHIEIKIKGQLFYQSASFNFNVVESDDPGYVRVHENKLNLKRGDRMIFPIGQNFPSPYENGIPWGEPGEDYDEIAEGYYYNTSTGDTIFYGNNLFAYNSTEKAANTVAWNNYLEMIEQYLQMEDGGGSKYFRTIQTPYSSLIEFENKGDYYKRLHYAAETDKILDLCEKYDALFQFNLMIHEPMMKYANYGMWNWDWDHYFEDGSLPNHDTINWLYNYPVYCYNDDPSKLVNGVPLPGSKKPYEMFTNESDLAYHKQRTRYYIARYGYSTKIYEFEILSEPWHINEPWNTGQSNQSDGAPFMKPNHQEHLLAREAIENYHKVISEYIKDSLQHWRQLIGIDMAAELGNDDGGLDKSVLLPSIDIIGINPYYASPNSLIKSEQNNNTMFDNVNKINSLRVINGLKRVPIIIPEGGTDEAYHECSNYSMDPVDKMSLPFIGIAGYNSWPGYKPFKFTHENDVVTMAPHIYDMWKTTIRAKNHMNGDDVMGTLSKAGGYWTQHRQVKYLNNKKTDHNAIIETQYYTNNNYAVGYVRNLSYNLYTKDTNIDTLIFTNSNNEVETHYDYPCLKWNDPFFYRNFEFGDPNDDDFIFTVLNNLQDLEWNDAQKLRLKGFDHQNYIIKFYSFNDLNYGMGEYVDEYEGAVNLSTLNRLRLKFPTLTTGESPGPVLWFVISPLRNKSLDIESLPDDSNDSNANSKPSIYPNPSDGHSTILSNESQEIEITNLYGSILAKIKINKGINTIDTTFLPSGLYLIHFKKENVTLKFIIL